MTDEAHNSNNFNEVNAATTEDSQSEVGSVDVQQLVAERDAYAAKVNAYAQYAATLQQQLATAGSSTQLGQPMRQQQYDPDTDFERFRDNPKEFLAEFANSLRNEFKAEQYMQDLTNQQVNGALENVAKLYPSLNTQQGRYFIQNNALKIAEAISGNPMYAGVTIQEIFAESAKQVNQFISELNTSQSTHKQMLDRVKAQGQGFTSSEGAGTPVTDGNKPQAAKPANAFQLILNKLRKDS